MEKPGNIDINDYDYVLPDERIASRPAARRDQARLLTYRRGEIGENVFDRLPGLLPEGALLLFNDTRVIEARLPFRRATGARIELFCLEPVSPVEHQLCLSSRDPVIWSCLVGNSKRWKEGALVREITGDGHAFSLRAEKLRARAGAFDIRFSWDDPGMSFAEVLHLAGKTPLPPYIKREADTEDGRRYQTVYAEHDGSVAAPTAGLHFTSEVLGKLDVEGFQRYSLTLHVGAGTFLPVKADRLADHAMHREKVSVGADLVRALHQAVLEKRPVIPVGTTSMRVLESLFWHGQSLALGKADAGLLDTRQWDPYEDSPTLTAAEALDRIVAGLDASGRAYLGGQTQLLIAPGYRFRLATGLITNFHQPRSTLLLLIAALIGEDWRRAYRYALDHDFRFLSYGDSCLLLP